MLDVECSFSEHTTSVLRVQDNRLDVLLHEVLERAVALGLPRLNVTIARIRPWMACPPWVAHVDAWSRNPQIEIWAGRFFRTEDWRLKMTIAHELGHILSHCAAAQGHPAIKRIRRSVYNEEDFSDLVAAYLYGAEKCIQDARDRELMCNEELLMKFQFPRSVHAQQ